MALLPELVLLAGATVFFFVSLIKAPDKKLMQNLAVVFGVLTFIASGLALSAEGSYFFNAYAVDQYSQLFKLLIGFALAVVLIFTNKLKDIDPEHSPEYQMFLLLSGLGLMMLVSAVELIAVFIALELSSFALYLMVPMRDDRTGGRVQMEAGIKYLLFGVMATGFMLYGMSLVYGLTGSTYLKDIIPGLSTQAGSPTAFVGVVLILAGFFYKLAVFPFHFWVPDTYQGASNETTAFIATVPKLGAVALLIRFMVLPMAHASTLINLLIVLALCSMFYGNLCALVQKDVKRILGFSGISHAGFILLGLLTMHAEGYGLAIYYIGGYVLMNLACFLVICSVSHDGSNLEVDDLNGLYQRQPALAFILAVGLFALAGIPPFIGFMGKFLLLTGALKMGHLLLVILAAFNTAIALYYYLIMVKAAYTNEPDQGDAIQVSSFVKLTGFALVVMIVLFGALPSKLVAYAGSVVQSIM